MNVLNGDQLWLLVLAGVALGWTIAIAYTRPAAVAGLALGLFAFETIFGAPAGLNLSGILVYPRDGVFLAMAVAGGVRFAIDRRRGHRSDWAWWAFLLLAVLSLVRGVQALGADRAGNDFRGIFYLLAGVTFFATHRSDRRLVRDVLDVWIGVALVLVLVGLARATGVQVGVAIEQQPFLNGRALYAWPALLIGQAALISYFAEPLGLRWARVRGLPQCLCYLFLAGVLIFRHRTVWVAMMVSLVALWTVLRPVRGPAPERLGRSLAGLVVGIVLVTLVALTGAGETFRSDVARSAESATSEESTFVWRVEGWKDLLESQGADGSGLVFGAPYGSGYQRRVFGAAVNYSPHSWYVQTIARVGLVGLGCMIMAVWKLFRAGRSAGLLPRNLGAVMVLSSVVYGIAYQPPETQGILLGLVALGGRRLDGEATADRDGEYNGAAGTAPELTSCTPEWRYRVEPAPPS